VVHLLNRAYEAGKDAVRPLGSVELRLDLAALGVAGATDVRLVAPGMPPVATQLSPGGGVTVDLPGEWAIVVLTAGVTAGVRS
jgi:hypothetical protein